MTLGEDGRGQMELDKKRDDVQQERRCEGTRFQRAQCDEESGGVVKACHGCCVKGSRVVCGDQGGGGEDGDIPPIEVSHCDPRRQSQPA